MNSKRTDASHQLSSFLGTPFALDNAGFLPGFGFVEVVDEVVGFESVAAGEFLVGCVWRSTCLDPNRPSVRALHVSKSF